jgi:hypothetical protein
MAKKVTAAEAGLLQLKKQTDRLIREAKQRSARFRKVEETATTESQRKQAQREQQRIANLMANLLSATEALIAEQEIIGTSRCCLRPGETR